MGHRSFAVVGGLIVAIHCAASRPVKAQLSLSDDIIIAAQGEASKQKAKQSELGRSPGAISPLFGTSAHPTPLRLQNENSRPHREFLERTARAIGDDMRQRLPQGGQREASPMSVPRLVMPSPIPEPEDRTIGESDFFEEVTGPPDGLTLDQAIARLVAANNELRTKFHEIHMAEADVLTAGLRENPLLFYDSTNVPYGSNNAQRPGSVDHGVSVVLPLDYSGKRKARMTVARAAKRVREAQYQDAVRTEIDNLYSVYVNVLDGRNKVRRAEESLRELDRLMEPGRRGSPEAIDDLLIDRETAAIRVEDERKRLLRSKQILAESLAIPPREAAGLELHGTIRDPFPPPPPTETLIQMALERRPDVAAHRLGIPHALAEHERSKAERLPNAYLLYSPFSYTDRRAPGELDSKSWGAGIFVPIPLFDRNQGNIQRSQINVGRTQSELSTVERQVVTEVQAASQEYLGTRSDLDRLERQILPLIQKKRNRSRARFQAGEIDEAEFLRSQGEHASTIRHYHELQVQHRRSMLDLNTAVGCRVLP